MDLNPYSPVESPPSSATVRVVLEIDGDELELGPFTQGVVIERSELIDIATRKVIAEMDFDLWWLPTSSMKGARKFKRCFIQSAT